MLDAATAACGDEARKESAMAMELKSRRHTVNDLDSAMELCYTNGWTDGLPVVPPTRSASSAMLAAAGLAVVAVRVHREPPGLGDRREGRDQRRHGRLQGRVLPVWSRPSKHRRSAVRLSRAGDEHGRLSRLHGGERADRDGDRHELVATTCSGRAGAPTRRSGARCASSCATRSARCRASSTAAAGHGGKYSVLYRGKRSRQPVATVSHDARLFVRPERGDDLRGARAAPVFEPALRDARRDT